MVQKLQQTTTRTMIKIELIFALGALPLSTISAGEVMDLICGIGTPPDDEKPTRKVSSSSDSPSNEMILYLLKSFYIQKTNQNTEKLAKDMLKYGAYYHYLEIEEIRNRWCFGWSDLLLKVTIDDIVIVYYSDLRYSSGRKINLQSL